MPWKYTVTNYDQIYSANRTKVAHQEDLEGWLSPTSPLTLPPMIKKQAGIPEDARNYAFMYPPKGLAEILSQRDRQDSVSDDPDSESLQPIINKQGIESAAILGGFAYFDKNYECICINALSLERSEHTLRFSGPFRVNQSACDELYRLRLPQPLQLDIFHEVGFVSYAWVRPNQSFQSKSVFVTDQHTKKQSNHNGTMLFFRENGTAEAYVVDQSQYVDPSGYVGILSEAVSKINQSKLTDHVIQPIDKVKAWGGKVKYWTKSIAIAKLVGTIENKKTLLHMVCHAALGHTFIIDVLSHTAERPNLSYQDSFGWNPLHYACCFSPSDGKLIKLLVTICPEAVAQFDYYYRSPLHIACNSDTSKEVIAVLLEADRSIPKVSINTKTRRFGLLPLHLACFNGASDGIINALLDADYGGMTAIKKSRYGQLPLHLAIMKKLPAGIVKVFLDADSKLSKSDRSNFDPKTPYFDGDIYQPFDGKLPLHLACFNNSSSEIIQLLLEKDEHNITINETVNTSPESVSLEGLSNRIMKKVSILMRFKKIKMMRKASYFSVISSSYSMLKRLRKTKMMRKASDFSALSSHRGEEGSDGDVALHLAMRHGSADVITLLLRKGMEKGTDRVQLSMLHKTDRIGRTPLHIACQYNVGYQIIQSLLNLDQDRKTTNMKDSQGFMPIHYAHKNRDTSAETINILLDAEYKYTEKLLDEFFSF